jgi:DNA-binding transcriptional LysR family regulator
MMQIEPDVANVRAFVVAAHELHFGRAAGKLFLSQQGLSKRISRLEANLGVTLFVRTAGSVSLTDAGRQFWPHAERLVELANAAAAATQPASASPLRVDVWGHVQQPLRLVREIFERNEDVQVEVGMRRSTAAALDALQRGEIDAAFGNVDHLDRQVPPEVERRLMCMTVLLEGDEIHQARITGAWPRLKGCRQCGYAFFDRSNNRSASWCAISICGNRTKNRATDDAARPRTRAGDRTAVRNPGGR